MKTLFQWDKGTWSLGEKTVKFFNGTKVLKNVTDINERVETLNYYFLYRDTAPTMSDAEEDVEATTGLFSNMHFCAPFDYFGTKNGENISCITKFLQDRRCNVELIVNFGRKSSLQKNIAKSKKSICVIAAISKLLLVTGLIGGAL